MVGEEGENQQPWQPAQVPPVEDAHHAVNLLCGLNMLPEASAFCYDTISCFPHSFRVGTSLCLYSAA